MSSDYRLVGAVMKKNIAVAGCGYWGRNLVRNFSELGSLAAVCDADATSAEELAKRFAVPALPFDEVLEHHEIEGVVLAVPAPLHATMAIQALEAGLHVYVEKPLAMSIEEANQMVDCANNSSGSLMVGHLLRYHPVFVKLLEIVKSGALGRIYEINSSRLSFGKVRPDEDVIWSFAPHDISMLLAVAGELPYKLRSQATAYITKDICDSAVLHMTFSSALSARIFLSWSYPAKEQKLVVIGEAGSLIFDDGQEWGKKLTHYHNVIEAIPGGGRIHKGLQEFIPVDESEPLKEECSHFLDVVNLGVPPLTDGVEGLQVLEVLSAASKSKDMGQEVYLSEL